MKKGLRIVYRDFTSSFEELLTNSKTVSFHHRNIQLVEIEMFKVKHNLCSTHRKDLFQLNLNPNVRKTFLIPNVNTEKFGKSSLCWFGPVVWERMLPEYFKSIQSLERFKEVIKIWIPKCACRLCKTYIGGLGFVEIFE